MGSRHWWKTTVAKASAIRVCPKIGAVCLCVLASGLPHRIAAQQAPSHGYSLQVGKLVMTSSGPGDWFSAPDMAIRVERQDSASWEAIHRFDDEIKAMVKVSGDLDEAVSSLMEKKAASEIEPGSPLTRFELERLAQLESKLVGQCSEQERRKCRSMPCETYPEIKGCSLCSQCAERRDLRKRKTESEVVPGPALTVAETRQLEDLRKRQKELQDELGRARSERRRVYATVVRETESITTRQTTMHFGDVNLITVYPDDVLVIKVVESDGGKGGTYELYDDVATVVPRHVLAAGESQLRSRKIRLLELKFRRLGRGSPAGEFQGQR